MSFFDLTQQCSQTEKRRLHGAIPHKSSYTGKLLCFCWTKESSCSRGNALASPIYPLLTGFPPVVQRDTVLFQFPVQDVGVRCGAYILLHTQSTLSTFASAIHYSFALDYYWRNERSSNFMVPIWIPSSLRRQNYPIARRAVASRGLPRQFEPSSPTVDPQVFSKSSSPWRGPIVLHKCPKFFFILSVWNVF